MVMEPVQRTTKRAIARGLVVALMASFLTAGLSVISSVTSDAAGEGITTFAGTHSPTSTATEVHMNPGSLTSGGSGAMMVVDLAYNTIRRLELPVTTTSVEATQTVIAGNGARGVIDLTVSTTATGNPLTLSHPLDDPPSAQYLPGAGATPDDAGGFYFTEPSLNRIRRVSSGGTVSNQEGNGSTIDTPVVDGVKAVATEIPLDGPTSIVAEGTTYYFSETGSNCVRKIEPGLAGSRTLTTIGANGGSGAVCTDTPTADQLLQPAGIAIDSTWVYIADWGHHRIVRARKDGTGGLEVVAGTGTLGAGASGVSSTSSALSGPMGVALDSAGNLYIADTGNDKVRMVTAPSPVGTISTVPTGVLSRPRDVEVDADVLYVADSDRVCRALSGECSTIAGDRSAPLRGDGGDPTKAQFGGPVGLSFDSGGVLLIADAGDNRIRSVGFDGKPSTIAGSGTAGYSGDGGPATAASLRAPAAVAAGTDGSTFIADTGNHVIRRVASGSISTIMGDGIEGSAVSGTAAASARLSNPQGILVDGAGVVWIADSGNGVIWKIVGGTVIRVAGGGSDTGEGVPATDALLADPRGIAFDPVGDLYIAETGANRVRKVDFDGSLATMTTVAGGGGSLGDGGPATSAMLSSPTGVSVSNAREVFIADRGQHRIRKVATDGTITTFAGNGTAGYSGDSGLAASPGTRLSYPAGVVVDCSGSVFIADSWSRRIRKVQVDAPSGSGGYWLDSFGGVHAWGNVPAVDERTRWSFPIARGLVMLPDLTGGYVLDGWGGVHGFNTSLAPDLSVPPPTLTADGATAPVDYFPGNDIARGLLLDASTTRTSVKGYWLDGYGALHRFSSFGVTAAAVSEGPSWPGWDIARGAVMMPADPSGNSPGGYILDGYGGIHRFVLGDERPPKLSHDNPYWSGWDIARGITLRVDGGAPKGGYIVDGWGGVHRFALGATPVSSVPRMVGGPSWPGWDIARGITIRRDDPDTSSENEADSGAYVLDGYGGLHVLPKEGGAEIPNPCNHGYSPFAGARAIVSTN